MSASSIATASFPSCCIDCRTVVRGGSARAASGTSSKPTTERSRGTTSPRVWATCTVPMAERSFAANTAVGRSGRSSSAVAASRLVFCS